VRVRIWGCRGSLASPGPETVRYGGNTSCVEVRSGDTVLVLDAGTGIRPLGLDLDRERRRVLHLLLTHLHLDHVEGLGFFAPIWHPETELHVWGPPSPVRRLEERIARYLSPPLFPVHLSDIPAHITFHDAPEGEWEIDGIGVVSAPVSHPGPTIGYRLSAGGISFTYIPDHEPVLGVDLAQLPPEWISGHALAAGTDLLFHDGQYTEEEYPRKVGWGHSSVAHAVAFAARSEAQRLVLFHHDPLHGDDELDALRERAQALWNGNGRAAPRLAYEGMEIEV
jgi:phosphoribosyl 1,2-cyclic phosphodiesterase